MLFTRTKFDHRDRRNDIITRKAQALVFDIPDHDPILLVSVFLVIYMPCLIKFITRKWLGISVQMMISQLMGIFECVT